MGRVRDRDAYDICSRSLSWGRSRQGARDMAWLAKGLQCRLRTLHMRTPVSTHALAPIK